MINIVTGVPGSGKSYYSVYYLYKHFVEYDKFYNTYLLRSDVLLITNIDNLKLDHINLDRAIESVGSVEKFFTIETFEAIRRKYGKSKIILIIDEAQKFFDRRFFNKQVFFFFQYHRHLGLDIFLITQDKNFLAKEIRNLSEFIIVASPRSLQIPTKFKYDFYSVDGVKLYSKFLPKDKNVFNMYRSFEHSEVDPPKSAYLPYVFSFVVFLIFAFLSFYFVKQTFFNHSPIVKSEVKPNPKSQSKHQSKSNPKPSSRPKPNSRPKSEVNHKSYAVVKGFIHSPNPSVIYYDPSTSQYYYFPLQSKPRKK